MQICYNPASQLCCHVNLSKTGMDRTTRMPRVTCKIKSTSVGTNSAPYIYQNRFPSQLILINLVLDSVLVLDLYLSYIFAFRGIVKFIIPELSRGSSVLVQIIRLFDTHPYIKCNTIFKLSRKKIWKNQNNSVILVFIYTIFMHLSWPYMIRW